MITSQVNGDYECRNERMKKYLEEVKSRTSGLEVKFVQIPREENECADRLAKAASAEFMNVPEQILSFVQTSSLIDDGKQIQERPHFDLHTELMQSSQHNNSPQNQSQTSQL